MVAQEHLARAVAVKLLLLADDAGLVLAEALDEVGLAAEGLGEVAEAVGRGHLELVVVDVVLAELVFGFFDAGGAFT